MPTPMYKSKDTGYHFLTKTTQEENAKNKAASYIIMKPIIG